MSEKKPKIIPLENGPYYLEHDSESTSIEFLENSKGEKISSVKAAALCRCGGSSNKPFCDGTHMKNEFKSAKVTDGKTNRRINHVGKDLIIHDNRGICAHAAFCISNSPDVFRSGQKPWVNPDSESADKTIKTIKMCPSGALSYSTNGTEHRDRDSSPKVTVSKNGPYLIQGDIELTGEEFGDGASKEHYALCRCGHSKNKPFCDGSHKPEHGEDFEFIDEKN